MGKKTNESQIVNNASETIYSKKSGYSLYMPCIYYPAREALMAVNSAVITVGCMTLGKHVFDLEPTFELTRDSLLFWGGTGVSVLIGVSFVNCCISRYATSKPTLSYLGRETLGSVIGIAGGLFLGEMVVKELSDKMAYKLDVNIDDYVGLSDEFCAAAGVSAGQALGRFALWGLSKCGILVRVAQKMRKKDHCYLLMIPKHVALDVASITLVQSRSC